MEQREVRFPGPPVAARAARRGSRKCASRQGVVQRRHRFAKLVLRSIERDHRESFRPTLVGCRFTAVCKLALSRFRRFVGGPVSSRFSAQSGGQRVRQNRECSRLRRTGSASRHYVPCGSCLPHLHTRCSPAGRLSQRYSLLCSRHKGLHRAVEHPFPLAAKAANCADKKSWLNRDLDGVGDRLGNHGGSAVDSRARGPSASAWEQLNLPNKRGVACGQPSGRVGI